MTQYVLIMAGGSGERFFPLSRAYRPKQLLPLLGDGKTLLEHTIARCRRVVDDEHIIVITSEILRTAIVTLLGDTIPPENIIAEPAKRNTAGCLTYGAALVGLRDPAAVIAALPADHFIGDEERFAADLTRALRFATTHDAIVTFGIMPARPETGYGYIERGEPIHDGFFQVASFREKPDRVTAEQFLASGKFLWNSGIFIFRLDFFERELRKYAPAFGDAIDPLRTAMSIGDSATLSQIFGQLPNLSIDYALMEKTESIAVLFAAFPWDDLGAWDSLMRIMPPDDAGNVRVGACVALDTANTICANYADRPVLLCTLGVENVVAVVTDDVVLVCSRDDVQHVRRIVEFLRTNDMEQWL